MIEQDVFKRHVVGRDGFQWWIGQVVNETAWIKNIPAKKEKNNSSFEGIGERYKVRIMGYHTAEKDALPDEQLPWASVIYPTTAGGGGGNFSESAVIPQGTFVFGFFLDGDNAQQPVILGCMGYNDYNEVMKNVPNTVFKPFSGYPPGKRLPTAGMRAIGSSDGTSLTQGELQSIASSTPNQTDPGIVQGVVEVSPGVYQVDRLVNGAIVTTTETSAPAVGSSSAPAATSNQTNPGIVQGVVDIGGGKYQVDRLVNGAIVTTIETSAPAVALNQTTPSTNDGGGPNNATVNESADNNLEDKATDLAKEESTNPLHKTKACEPLPISTIQKQIRNAIQEVERLRKTVYNFSSGASNDIADLHNKIERALERASKWISASMKDVYNFVMRYVLKVVNIVAKPILSWIPLDKRTLGEEALGVSTDAIVCGFKNLINMLLARIREFLNQTILTAINAPMCFVETFVAGFMGAASGLISGIVGALQNSIGALADAAMGPLNLASDILSMVDNIFNFLSCEFDPECSTLTEWSILGGQSTFGLSDIQTVIDSANNIAQGITNIPGDIADSFTAALDIDVAGMFNNALGCFTDAIPCGPPGVALFSQSGAGAVANLVISDLGEVIGVDMLSFGVGYDQSTRATVASPCGQGNGAVLVPNIGGGAGGGTGSPNWTATAGTDPYSGAGSSGQATILPSSTTIVGDITTGSPTITNITVQSGVLENILPGSTTLYSTNDVGLGTVRSPVVVSVGDTSITTDQEFDTTEDDVPFTASNGNTREGQIISMTVMDPGAGYLPAPDGSTGGDGRVWANFNDTTIKRPGITSTAVGIATTVAVGFTTVAVGFTTIVGIATWAWQGDGDVGIATTVPPRWEIPVPPGWDIKVEPGDTVKLPDNTCVISYPHEEEICGGPHKVRFPGSFTSPDPRDFDGRRGEYPSSDSGSYPVILSLCELIITDSGLNYKEGDKIVMVPNMGAEAVPQFDRFGRVIRVKITNPGEGFRTYPKVYIESDSGYNVELIPRFCIDRISEEKIQEVGREKVLNVVDCVGRLPSHLIDNPCHSCNDTSMVW